MGCEATNHQSFALLFVDFLFESKTFDSRLGSELNSENKVAH